MKKSLLVLALVLLAGLQSFAQNEWPNHPYYHAELETPTQDAFKVSTDKMDFDLKGVTRASFVMLGAWVDQVTLGDTASYVLDDGNTFAVGQLEDWIPTLSDPRIVKEAASGTSVNNSMKWGATDDDSFNKMSQRLFYTVEFTKKGDYKLYLRTRGNNNAKFNGGVQVYKHADTSVVFKNFLPLQAAGINGLSATGDVSTDGSLEFVNLAYDANDRNNNSMWMKTTDSISIETPGLYVVQINHTASYRTNFGGFTFLKIPSYTLPEVSIISPENGWLQKQGEPMSLVASANALGGKTIAGVEFFEGENSIGNASLMDSKWVLENWTPAVGVYTVKAVVTDSEDETATSLPITITVEEIPDDVWADTIPNDSLIISEVMFPRSNYRLDAAYVEFTNMSSKTIDMSKYFIHNTNTNGSWGANQSGYEGRLKKRLSGLLAPGESYLYTKRQSNTSVDGYGERVYPEGYHNIELERISDMPINDYWTGDDGCYTLAFNVALTYVQLNGDSAIVDVFGAAKGDPETLNNQPHTGDKHTITVAGKSGNDPIREWVFVRKFDIKSGNTSFSSQMGIDEIDSEWIPLPRTHDGQFEKVFTTAGSHGGSTELVISSDIATIDKNAMKITLPYGVSRDSVFRVFETGPNTAWELQLNADTSQFFVQTGDTLHFYVAGAGVKGTYTFGVTVNPKTDDFAQVRPAIYQNPDNISAWIRRYSISDGKAPMDTIGGIPFHESIDTFIKYMEIEEGGLTSEGLSWTYIPANGVESPEIEYGDILEVTAKDGSKKQYKLITNDYFPNHSADLKLVIIPGLEFENPETFMYTDTMLSFSPNNLNYVIDLPIGMNVSPAIIAKASNSKAVVEVSRAKDLNGSSEDKTATIKVTAEDDTTILEYKILFKVQRETPSVKGELFISDISRGWGRYYKSNYQLFNPTDEMIDLTEYAFMFLPGGTMYDPLISNSAVGQGFMNQNAYIVRPGYKIMDKPEGVVFETDLIQEHVLLDPKGVYAIADFQAFPMQNKSLSAYPAQWAGWGYKLSLWLQGNSKLSSENYKWWNKHVEVTGFPKDPYGVDGLLGQGFNMDPRKGGSFILTKIVNDSIKDGIKSVSTSYAQMKSDFEVIDVFNGEGGDADWTQYDNDTLLAWGPLAAARVSYSFTRKPTIYTGNPVTKLSFGLGDSSKTYVPSEWDVIADPSTRALVRADAFVKFGEHLFLSNAHISYLTSTKYVMGEGLEGPQDVLGVEANTTGDQFLATLIKSDPGMTIKVLNPDDSEKELDTDMKTGDKIWSKSANGFDSVLYVVKEIAPLSDDCSLASSMYTVAKDGATGTISGIEMGTSIMDIMETLTPAANATMIQTNGGEEIIPLEQYNNDTMMIQAEERIKLIASDRVYIEVTAQNKVAKCLYALEFKEVEIPFILSNVYKVDEDNKVIDFVAAVTPEKFLSNLIASPGATMKVVNKAYQDRTSAIMKYDDRVVVTKGNVSVIYLIKYSLEPNDGLAGIDIDLAVEKPVEAALSAYPNPTTDYVSLTGFKAISKITVRDITGRMIKSSTAGSTIPKIDMRSYPEGIYFIKVISSVGETTFKVIKE